VLIAGRSEDAAARDLTSWQERHAVLVLSRAKVCCPLDLALLLNSTNP
jgi:hypothetical protein